MNNPWPTLGNEPPFVLKEDRTRAKLWAKCQKVHDFRALPEPFIGNPDASVVLLNLNPGFNECDRWLHQRPEFRDLIRGNLSHKSETPFYFLDERIINTPGGQWWNKRLKSVIDAVGVDCLSSDLLCVEWYPYHSDRFVWRKGCCVPSQKYSVHLVKEAIERGAVLVAMRGLKRWLEDVPQLDQYPNLVHLSNPRSVYISPKNCKDFDRIVQALRSGPHL